MKAGRTLRAFQRDDSFVRVVVGPFGSGKSTACVMEILRRAQQQAPGPDGIRRTRCAVIRNTYSQLRDTTRKTFEQWVPPGLGRWHEQSFTWLGRWYLDDAKTDAVECEVMFRALDRPEDVKKLLSLELTFAYINEVREISKHILDGLESRVSRYPSRKDGGPTWFGIWADSNPWHGGHWGAKLFAKHLPGYRLFRQPGGRSPDAENLANLDPNYYPRLAVGKDREWIRVYVDGEDATGDMGSVYGAWVDGVRQRGGLLAFDHPVEGVYTSWDLGKSDSTGIWFWRINAARSVDIIDHYENAGQGLGHYLGVVDAKPYTYVRHWLPHDARAETLATQQTVLEQCAEHWGVAKVGITPSIGLDDGIGALRWLLEQPGLRIHERCATAGRLEYSGVDALEGYRFKWDEKNQCFSTVPVHNWASHTADAARYLAVVVKHVEGLTRPPKNDPAKPYARSTSSFSLDELFDARERARD